MTSQFIHSLQATLRNIAGQSSPNRYGEHLFALMEKYNPDIAPEGANIEQLAYVHPQIGHFVIPLLEMTDDLSKLGIRTVKPSDGELIRSHIASYDLKLTQLSQLQQDCALSKAEVDLISEFIQESTQACKTALDNASEAQLNWTGLEVDLEKPFKALWSGWRGCWDGVDEETKTTISACIRELFTPKPMVDLLNEGKLDAAGARSKIVALKRGIVLKVQESQQEPALQPVFVELDKIINLCQKYIDLEKAEYKGRA